jgi:hypothetical protein
MEVRGTFDKVLAGSIASSKKASKNIPHLLGLSESTAVLLNLYFLPSINKHLQILLAVNYTTFGSIDSL